MRRSWKFSVLSGFLAFVMSASVYAGDLKEPKTGKTFVGSQEVWGKTWVGIGTGVRIKKVVGISAQVYAMALYIEKDAAAGDLAKWNGTDASKAQEDKDLYKAILNCACGRGVEITFLRDIEGPKIKEAFLEATGIELEATAGIKADDASVKDDMTKLGEFLDYNVKTNNKLKFFFSKKGSISAVGVGGSLTIKNPKLAKALLASWVGSSSRFSSDATLATMKKGLVSSIGELYK
jgi:hypothetical protein